MHRDPRARSVISDNKAMRRNHDAKNADVTCIGVCQAGRKGLCRSCFFNSHAMRMMRERMMRESRERFQAPRRGL